MARASKKARLDLHEALSRGTFHNAFLCTYTFEPLFFEDYCLERFNTLSNNNNISVVTDRSTYQKIVLTPDSQRPKQVNLRYLLAPIETKRRFHAKLFLLTTKTAGRLIAGSANFTRAGLTSNAELADVFDFEAAAMEEFLPLFQDAFSFVSTLAERWPSDSLASNLNELRQTTPWLGAAGEGQSQTIRLLHNLERPLWEQIAAMVPDTIDRIHVVSRFFDDSPTLIDRVMRDFGPRTLVLYTQNGVTTMTKEWLAHPCVRAGRAEILLCTYEDDGHQQPLHAKAIVFESDKTRTVVYGSANFTSPALLTQGKDGNIETLIIVSGIGTKAFDPRQFCDPSSTAHHLRSPDQLQTASREKDEQGPTMPIRLAEAILAENKLMMRASIPAGIRLDEVATRLHIQGSRGQLLPFTRIAEDRFSATISEGTLPRLQESSSLVSWESIPAQQPLSNVVFVTNLLSIETQSSVRQERHIREATQSAGQFFAVLNDLLRAGDDAALLTFLNFCDIPLVNAPRPPTLRYRPVWEGQDGMRSLGERNLHICKTLHEATLSFFDRHLRKLNRHIESRTAEGISNFLQIFLSMGSLLRMQIERVVIALEACQGNVSPQKWYECRQLWDVYFLKFGELMECLWDSYIQPLSSECAHKELRQEFGQDLEAIDELCDEMILYRERIEKVRNDKCIRRESGGRKIVFGYFYSVLEPTSWQRYAEGVQGRQKGVENAVLGRMRNNVPGVHIQTG